MATPQPFEVHAIKYAHHERLASQNFIGGDPHNGPMPLDYFVWVVAGPGGTFVIDTGFSAETAKVRQRQHIRCPAASLSLLGLDPNAVTDVIITHMHYDHAGNLDKFPKARFHIQDSEMAFVTGRCMCHQPLQHSFFVEDTVQMVRHLYAGRVCFHDGAQELAPGLSVHHVGGHTAGLQAVRVWTKRGWLVLASDASHLYANMNEVRPFPIVLDVMKMIEGYATLRRLADSQEQVIPGHDPRVLALYPASKPGLEGIACRLDLGPKER